MERLGQLLAKSALGHEDRETIKAAAIIAAASKVLQQELNLTPDEARARSYRRGEIIISASHGAIGGQISIHQERLLTAINRAIKKVYPGQEPVVSRLIIRQN